MNTSLNISPMEPKGLKYLLEPNELAIISRTGARISSLVSAAQKHPRFGETTRNAANSLVIVEKSGAFRFSEEFVRNFHPDHDSGIRDSTFEEYRIVSAIDRHLPQKYLTYEGAFELLNENVPGMVDRIGGEDAIRKTYQSDGYRWVRDSIDHIPFGNFRALVFSVHLLQNRKGDELPPLLGRDEANVRKDVRRFTRPDSTVELPESRPGTFRTFQDQYSDIRTLPFKNWPKELRSAQATDRDIVLELSPGDYVNGILPRAAQIFKSYPSIERVFCAVNGKGFEIPRWADESGDMQALSAYAIK